MPSSKVQCAKSEEQGSITRVLIIDDSPLMCRAIESILKKDPDIQIAGCAHSGPEALEILQQESCDICTLDVHMPGMNGITVLKHIMVKYPCPTLMVSAFTSDGARITFDALRYGAVDFFQKPSSAGGKDLESQADTLRSKVKCAARVQVDAARYLRLKLVVKKDVRTEGGMATRPTVNIISTSTGGYSSLLSLLPAIDAVHAGPVLVYLGVPEDVLNAFLDYLRSYVALPVERAGDGEELKPGTIYFMGKGECVNFDQHAGRWITDVSIRQNLPGTEGPVDLTLFSAAEHFGSGARAVFLSGDDRQGFSGARELLRNHGSVLIQRPATCLSPAVPCMLMKEVGDMGGEEVTLSEMASIISKCES